MKLQFQGQELRNDLNSKMQVYISMHYIVITINNQKMDCSKFNDKTKFNENNIYYDWLTSQVD